MTDLQAASPPLEPVQGPGTRKPAAWTVVLAVVGISAVAVMVTLLAAREGGGTPRITTNDAVVGATNAEAAAAYLRLTNSGNADDRLTRVTSPEVGDVTLHVTDEEGGISTMRAVDGIDVPAGGSVSLLPGGSHLMLTGATQPMRVGETVTLHLEFEQAPPIDVHAQVVPLADLADRVNR